MKTATVRDLTVKPMSLACQRFMARVASYDFRLKRWFTDPEVPSKIEFAFEKDEASRWLSVMLAIKKVMGEHGLTCSVFVLNKKGDGFTINGIVKIA